MRITQAIGKRALACLLALVTTASAVTMPSYAAQVPQDIAYIGELLDGKDAPYDLMIRFRSDGFEGLSRKEIASSTQQEAKDLLKEAETAGDVDLWESFYITNLIHAEINSKDLVYQLAELADVESITWNGKVERIQPVEDDSTEQNKRKAASASIYQPDERDIEWGVLLVHADKVWEEFSIDGTGATVGIIDGGANYNLPALKKAYKDYDAASGSVIIKEDNPNTPQWEGGAYRDFVDGTDTPQTTTSDDHGSHVAGTIVGAEGENTNRIGVAPGAKFITARAMGVDGGEEADLIAAAEWMLEMKPDVINNSWGGANDDDPWFEDVVDAWEEAGIVPVFAAGNTSDKIPGAGSISNPANYPNVLAVGAVDRDKKIGRFSHKGPSAFGDAGTKPEVCAPGVQVRSVDSHGSYVSWNGTSMAAPHVTGVVALIRQAAKVAGKEDAYDTLDEIRALLEETAEPLTDSTYTGYPNIAYGYGLVNAYDAVAKIMGRDSVTIEGVVLQDGDDETPPEPSFLNLNEGYLGRDVQVNVQIKDDVSVRSAKLTYTVPGKEAKTADLTLVSGLQNDGVYAFTIPGTELVTGMLALEVTAVDYGNHSVTITKNMDIRPGMTIPWSQDFEDAENGLPGFLMDGCWNFSTRKTDAEPELPEGLNGNENSTYIGIDAGFSFFDRKIDSNLYLPPIDLSNVSAAEHPSLNVDMYNGFTGISQAKIQVSTIGGGEDSWEDLYHVILRPDITDRAWTHCTFSLEKYAGNTLPLQIRVYFYGHDADEGVGWYLDNFSVTTKESSAPEQVQALHANVSSKGLRVSFDANEETDVTGYSIERKALGGTFEEIATIDQNLDNFQFINKGEEETRTESHYHVNYMDATAQPGNTYVYRVRAYDFSGNYSAYSQELEVAYQSYSGNVVYDFEDNDGGLHSGSLSETANDWEWGKPAIPENLEDMSLLPRTAWSGLAKNSTNMWGSPLGKKPSQPQDSYLLIPSVTVNAGDYLYFDSFCAINSASAFVSFTVDIKEVASEYWLPLVSRETIMNSDQIFTWWQIGASLEDYAGKAVDIRFRTVADSGYLDAYNLGWHIDNVSIGSQQGEYHPDTANGIVPEGRLGAQAQAARGLGLSDATGNDQMGIGQPRAKASGSVSGTLDGTAGIPIRAKVTVAGSGRYTYSSVIDGSYSVKQAAAGDQSYTINIEAYGYEPKSVTVSGAANITVPPVFMTKAQTASLTGQIKDSNGVPLSGASLRLVEDTMAPVLTTDISGAYTGDAYVGTYTARFFKEGYRSVEQSVTLSAGQNTIPEVRLEPLGDRVSEKTDYGYVEDTDSNGNYQTIQFTSGPHGVAVLFQSPHVGGILKSAEVFFVKNNYYSGDHILAGVLAYDEKGRLRELAPFRTVEDITPNAWNTIDFSEFTIETDKPVYVAFTYDKYEFSECMGVYYDTDAQKKAIDKSFIYDGSFTATSSISPVGAYAVKANWLYTEGAATNTEIGDDDDVDPPIIDDENAFVFDTATQTITGYRGSQTKLVIPAKIDGVAVKRIGRDAFSGFGKDSDKKLLSVVIPEGVEEIGVDAFKTNQISSITFPSTLKTIGAGAFKFQYGKDMELTIPESVTVIAESAFQSAASPMTVTMPGVTKIEKLAFDGNRDIKVYANRLTEIADEAFGVRSASDFPYAKVYTAKNTTLASVNQQHLINPAVVTVMEINSRDSEEVFGKTTLYGTNQTSIGRNQDVSNFYQTGKTVAIAPPDFRKNGKIYTSADKPVTLELEQENTLTFYYDTLAPRLRTPILDVDKEILGFSLPKAAIDVSIDAQSYSTTANEDGFFIIPVSDLTAGTVLTIQVNGKAAGSETVTQYKGEQYITSGNVITRYMGNGGALTLPTAVGSSGSVTEIAPFAFYGVQLTSVVLPDTVETIGTGAFMKTGLKSFGWNLKNLNSAKLRTIDEYAFRDNALEKVAMPELTHRIRTGAFENNAIVELQLGKYTGHIGVRAFKNNQIKVLEMSDTAEEIGIEAFMSNQIESLTIKPRLPGYEDGLELIPERAYAGNKLTEVVLPETVTTVDKTAFADNVPSGKRFIVVSDAKSIVPTAGYDVRRSNGTLLTWQNGNTTPSPSGGGAGGGGAVDRVVVTNPAGGSATLKNGTLTVTPKAGYAVDKVTVNGKEVTLTGGKLEGVKSTDQVVVSFKAIEPAPTGSFVDVPAGAYYADAVAWAVAHGITQGTDPTHFSPYEKTTRAQVVTFLYRAAGSPDVTVTDAFSDVAPNSYYEKAVVWAVENGITNGVRGGRFDPNADCTRAQIVTFLARYAKGTSAGGSNFTDVPTNAYYSDAVAWAVANGITDGTSATTFSPDAKCIRAHLAAFLYRLLGAQK